MYLARRLHRAHALRDRPCAGFIFTGCQERDKAEQVVGEVDHTVEARFARAERLAELGLVLRFHLRKVGFEFAAERRNSYAGPREPFAHLGFHRVGAVNGLLADVEDDDERFRREQLEVLQERPRLHRQLLLADGDLVLESGPYETEDVLLAGEQVALRLPRRAQL